MQVHVESEQARAPPSLPSPHTAPPGWNVGRRSLALRSAHGGPSPPCSPSAPGPPNSHTPAPTALRPPMQYVGCETRTEALPHSQSREE